MRALPVLQVFVVVLLLWSQGDEAAAKSLMRITKTSTIQTEFEASIDGRAFASIGNGGVSVPSSSAPFVVVRLRVRSSNGAITDQHTWYLNRSRFELRGVDQPPLDVSFEFEAITSCNETLVTDVVTDFRDLPSAVRRVATSRAANSDDVASADLAGAGPSLLELAIRASVLANACSRYPGDENRARARRAGKTALLAYDILINGHEYLSKKEPRPWPFGSNNWGL